MYSSSCERHRSSAEVIGDLGPQVQQESRRVLQLIADQRQFVREYLRIYSRFEDFEEAIPPEAMTSSDDAKSANCVKMALKWVQ